MYIKKAKNSLYNNEPGKMPRCRGTLHFATVKNPLSGNFLPGKMGERLVGFGHLVDVFTLFDSFALRIVFAC